MPIIENEYQLSTLSNGAVIRDRMGDVHERRGGLWCSYESAPADDHRVAKWLPAEALISETALPPYIDGSEPDPGSSVYTISESTRQVAAMTGLPIDICAGMLRAGWTLTLEVGKPTRWERQFLEVKRLGRTSQYVPAEQQFDPLKEPNLRAIAAEIKVDRQAEKIEALTAERDALAAVVEQVRTITREPGATWFDILEVLKTYDTAPSAVLAAHDAKVFDRAVFAVAQAQARGESRGESSLANPYRIEGGTQ